MVINDTLVFHLVLQPLLYDGLHFFVVLLLDRAQPIICSFSWFGFNIPTITNVEHFLCPIPHTIFVYFTGAYSIDLLLTGLRFIKRRVANIRFLEVYNLGIKDQLLKISLSLILNLYLYPVGERVLVLLKDHVDIIRLVS